MSEQGTGRWTTQRLVVRKGRAGDADEIWPWRENDEINQWLTSIPTSAEQNKDRWVAGLDTNYVAEMAGSIVATGKIASEQAWAQDEAADQAEGTQVEIGWVVAPDRQGQGIGTEFAKALLDIAFASGVRRVTAYCFADNAASARIMGRSACVARPTSALIPCTVRDSGSTPMSTQSWTPTSADSGATARHREFWSTPSIGSPRPLCRISRRCRSRSSTT